MPAYARQRSVISTLATFSALAGCASVLGIEDLPTGATDAGIDVKAEASVPDAAQPSACSGLSEQECGNCGTQTRTCNDGVWSAWSACAETCTCAGPGSQSCNCGL